MPVRRVVTGHNAQGKSVFLTDGPAPHVYQRSPGSTLVTELWDTSSTPASNAGDEDPTRRAFRLPPPKKGSVFRVISYPPDAERLGALAKEHASHDDDGTGRAGAIDRSGARHPGFHKTNSIDYAIVLSGEIYALMDEGETLLKQGDVLVQRGTNHAWSNRTNEPAVLAFVLVDAEPV
jgi:mannose-6-phosphate isomerase-like protein (cupin superfamily)